MKQRYRELTHELCVRAVLECFDEKWRRCDVLPVVEKYGGVTLGSLMRDFETGSWNVRLDAAESIAFELEQRVLDLLDGDTDALELEPVTIRIRPDGMTGKLREIADLCVWHQLAGHLVQLGLEPLFDARMEWGQCASLPGRGQSGLKRRVERWLRRKSLGIRCAQKSDVHHAYGSLQYGVCMELVRREAPRALWILAVMQAIAEIAPGGHLIIGGYLDAWLFNFAMSYALRYVLGLTKERRGRRVALVVRATTHMDDFALLGRRRADVVSATRKLARWMERELHLVLKPGSVVEFVSLEEEHRRRKEARPAARGCPCLDMGGYRMRRSYTTVRGCIWLRARRAFLRAGSEAERTGTMRVCRSRRLGAYYGYYKNSNARKAGEKINVEALIKLAGRVTGFVARIQAMKERLKPCCTYA